MDTYLAIASKRDERQYADRPIPADVVERILDAARLAGSSRNTQQWRFVVVEDREARERLANAVYAPDNVRGAAVVVAIVGNAAEHGGAVVVAYRGKIKLAAEIALASSAQVAVFLIPAVALLAWLIEPLALSFREVEIAALAVATVVTAALLADGRSSRWKGVVLVAVYVGIAAAFFVAGDRF